MRPFPQHCRKNIKSLHTQCALWLVCKGKVSQRQPEIPVDDLDAARDTRNDENVGCAEVAMDAVSVQRSHSSDYTDDQIAVHVQLAEAFSDGREEDVLHSSFMSEDLRDVSAGWCGVDLAFL